MTPPSYIELTLNLKDVLVHYGEKMLDILMPTYLIIAKQRASLFGINTKVTVFIILFLSWGRPIV